MTSKQLVFLGGLVIGLFTINARASAYIDERVHAVIAENTATKADIQRLDDKLDRIYELMLNQSGTIILPRGKR